MTHSLASRFYHTAAPTSNYAILQLSPSLTKLTNGFIPISIFSRIVVEENENNQKVLHFILENPGCHLRQIKRDLNMSMGTVQYHLNSLEKMGRIISEKHDLYRYYFPIGSFGALERNILKILNQDSEREILLFIIERKDPTQTDIVNHIKISHGTANWHLKRLIEYGIIREEKEGKFKKYHLNGSHDNIVKLLQNYHSSIWNKWSNRLAELFLSVSSEEDKE
ncbi:MAG: winged helix-turn-helix transcriptional regulator [Thaumarchaeota archaeon]|nr:winged helix-turn-helix transcriptional regulator [Nitrososphaerota archaeon]